jgi:hypothetical protein
MSIAIDGKKAILGKSGESRTQDEAQRSAMNDCTSQGGTNCKVLATSQNGCLAMVVGDNRLTACGRKTLLQAESAALEMCRNYPDTNCYVYYSGCVDPVLE